MIIKINHFLSENTIIMYYSFIEKLRTYFHIIITFFVALNLESSWQKLLNRSWQPRIKYHLMTLQQMVSSISSRSLLVHVEMWNSSCTDNIINVGKIVGSLLSASMGKHYKLDNINWWRLEIDLCVQIIYNRKI